MGRLRNGFGVVCFAVALIACKSEPGTVAPASSAPSSSPDRGFSPAAALAECHAAIAQASRAPATVEGARTLMIGCTSLVANHACRAAMREVLSSLPTKHPHAAMARCAEAYCPSLPAAASLAACRSPRPTDLDALQLAHAELGRAMLEHDFSGRDAQDAMEAWTRVVDYGAAVEPPRLEPPPSVRAPDRPLPQLHLKAGGAATLSGSGPERSAASVTEYDKAFPRAPEDGASIQIVAEAGIPFQDVIAAMDALRGLGYEHVSFGMRR